jgi:IS30 family transposase
MIPRRGAAHPNAVLTEAKVRAIRTLSSAGFTVRAIASSLRVHHTTVVAVLTGRTWGHVEDVRKAG